MRKERTGLRAFDLGGLRLSSIIILLFAVCSLLVIPINAQSKKRRTPPRKKTPTTVKSQTELRTEVIESLDIGCIPTTKESITILQISKTADGNLIFKTNENSSPSLDKILPTINLSKSTITIKADPSLDFGTVAKVLYETRRLTKDCVNIEASTDPQNPYVYYLHEPVENSPEIPKPNPLFLIIFISADRKIVLNQENQGSLDDTSQIMKRLKEVFNDREKNGVLRERTNVIETSLVVKPSRSVKFNDVMKLIDAVKETEASPINLVIDDLQP